MRVGIGFDAHRFSGNRKLVLGGVEIGYPMGLEGHSDADVLVHAVMDALLGAAGLRDIGVHFPDTDPEYSGVSSISLLREVREKLSRKGFSIINIDATLIMEKPKVSGYFEEMSENIANALGISREMVNVKATTTEGMGFSGRGEGIAAQGAALIEEKKL